MTDWPEIKLSPELGLPQQVAEHLAGEIREGVLELGQKLAPEAELCKKYLHIAAKRPGVRIYHSL